MGNSSLAEMLIRYKGKTTTTERMLYYSGHTRRIGSTAFSLLTISSAGFHFKFVFHFKKQLIHHHRDRGLECVSFPISCSYKLYRCRRRLHSHRLLARRESARRDNTVRSYFVPLATFTSWRLSKESHK